MKKLFVVILLALPMFAGDGETSPVLVPLFYRGGGAFGSQWNTFIEITNHTAEDFRSPGIQFIITGCPIPEGCSSDRIRAGEYGAVIEPASATGLILHVPKAGGRSIAFKANIVQGIEYLKAEQLPIVREDEFTREPVRLLTVPLHGFNRPIRSTLRVYGLDAIPGTMVRVDVRGWYVGEGTPIASKQYTLEVTPSPAGLEKPIFPAFAQIALQQDFPFSVLRGSTFNVTITPLPLPTGEIPRIWAFIAMVDNLSNDVRIQQPD